MSRLGLAGIIVVAFAASSGHIATAPVSHVQQVSMKGSPRVANPVVPNLGYDVGPQDSALGTPFGSLTDEQAGVIAKAIVDKLDQNHDGRLSKAEVSAVGIRAGRTNLNYDRWKEFDRDHDGYLTVAEVTDAVKAMNKARGGAAPAQQPAPAPQATPASAPVPQR